MTYALSNLDELELVLERMMIARSNVEVVINGVVELLCFFLKVIVEVIFFSGFFNMYQNTLPCLNTNGTWELTQKLKSMSNH